MLEVIRKFKLLSKEKKDMLALFWVYEFVGTTVGIFIGAFVFLRTGSISFLALFELIKYTGCDLAFAGFGYLMAKCGYSMKWNYLRAFMVYFIGFVWLAITPHTMPYLLIFAFINGAGLGLFWLGNHTYELLYTNNENGDRDFYSSMVQAGTQVISVLGPMVGTLLIFLSERIFKMETLTLLFWIIPLIYLVSLPFLFNLPHFIPKPITRLEIKSFFRNHVSKKIRWYYILAGEEEIRYVAISIFAIVALKTLLNIGLWQIAVGVISFFVTMLLSNVRQEKNRLRIMIYAIGGFLIAFSFVMFSNISVYFYIIFSLIMIVFKPIYRVSQHTIDLRSMDFLAHDRSSFYPGILYREVILYIGRFLALSFLILVGFIIKNDIFSARVVIMISAVILVINWFVARSMIGENNSK